MIVIIKVLCSQGQWNILFHTGPGSQPPSVVISGTDVDEMGLYFNQSITVVQFQVTVNDDEVALEDVEEYSLTITNTNPSQNVIVFNNGLIRIIDDDGMNVVLLKV